MKKINLIVLLCISLVFVGCDKDFVELNENPNDPTSVPSDLLLGSMLRATGDVMYSTFNGGDMGACWAQHFSKVQYNDEERFIPRESAINSVWDSFYLSVAADANAMYDLAVEEENVAVQGVANTMKAYAFLWLTDLYGDIPFTEALKGPEGEYTPIYDSQSTVYAGCMDLLDDAISKLSTGSGSIDSDQDLIYGGAISNWLKFATSLKFRAMMRSGNTSGLQALVDSGNLFSSTDEEAKLVYLSDFPNANPIYESVVYGTRGEWKICEEVVFRMDGTYGLPVDNRLPVYAQVNDAGIYRGKPSGIADVPSVEYSYANVSALGESILDPTYPAMFLGYTELQFLLAEAAHNGYISGDASTYYQAGIASSFAENGAAMGSYYSGNVVFNSNIADEQIATQKWLALYGQGFEAWTEWRRTGYPSLPVPIDAAESTIPSRYTYPVLEQSLNTTNYNEAVSNLSGGDELTSPIGWMNN